MERVLQASANLDAYLDVTARDAPVAGPSRVLGARLLGRLRRELAGRGQLPSALVASRRHADHVRRYHVLAYRSGNRVVIELEPMGGRRETPLLSAVNRQLQALARAEQPSTLLDGLVEGVRSLAGFDRVMVYRFDEDGHGSVVAESRGEKVDSYLDHHFPASDIPPQVRRLYSINAIRSIPDATADAVVLVPDRDPEGGVSLDLSAGMLRAVSPVHLTYLRNMGVGSSLSVAMHGDDGLWGLLACHGRTPRRISPALRDAVAAMVYMATSRLLLLQSREDARYLQRVHDSRGLLTRERGRLQGPAKLLRRHGPEWLALFGACGVALVYRDQVARVGRLPGRARLLQVAEYLSGPIGRGEAWYSRRLRSSPLAGVFGKSQWCGLLAVPLSVGDSSPGWLLLFRPEQVETRVWAGKPQDVPVKREGRPVLTPRSSFASWREEIRGSSLPWTPVEHRAAVELGEDLAVLAVSREFDELNSRLIEANRRLEHLAHTDPLTGTWNRYRVEQQIDAEIAAAERYDRRCALLLFDVDHFKQINDCYGHEAGDRVLTALAAQVQRMLRGSDYLGRWGGEEFVVLATNSDADAAGFLGERLRQSVAGMEIPGTQPVTVSVGVTTWHPGDNRRSMVARADQAMYRAKREGRNRVCSEV